MISVDPKTASTAEFHGHLVNAVGPRPIALASTVDKDGNPNLAPFSFYNTFGSNPATLVFSANLRVRNNTGKDTLANIRETRQVVVNAVSYNIVRQVSLASVEYAKEVNEFEKAGFTPLPSQRVRPFRVAEAPVQFECTVKDIIELGQQGGAGNLFICDIELMHISQAILNEHGHIDANKIDLCGRMGGHRYVRASGNAVFEIPQPVTELSIGFDSLPQHIRHSSILSGNDLAQLANVTMLPQVDPNFVDSHLATINQNADAVYLYAKKLIGDKLIDQAWQVLLSSH